jgi:hypothetical protein
MYKKIVLLALFLLLTISIKSESQVRFTGSLQSSLFSWETINETQLLDYYQGLQFKITPANYSNLSFSSYMRFAHRGDPSDWDDRLYNLAVNWKDNSNRYQFKLGRQFVYHGVMNGTVDGLLVSAKPSKDINIKFLGGLAATQNRSFGLREMDEANVFGGYLSYRLPFKSKIDVSYFQRSKDGNYIWQVAGGALNGKIKDDLYYNAQLDYNLQTSEIQTMRYRLSYYLSQWSFYAEYNNQKPRIFEDSYFKIFENEAYSQIRGGATYQFNQFQFGLQYLLTSYEEDSNNELHFTFGSNWGMVGLIYQDGFGGDNLGVYGDVRYPIIKNLFLRLYGSYYNYQRHTIEISENATSFSAGFQYNLTKSFQIRAEVQESINSYFKNDTRGLFRLNYFFNY